MRGRHESRLCAKMAKSRPTNRCSSFSLNSGYGHRISARAAYYSAALVSPQRSHHAGPFIGRVCIGRGARGSRHFGHNLSGCDRQLPSFPDQDIVECAAQGCRGSPFPFGSGPRFVALAGNAFARTAVVPAGPSGQVGSTGSIAGDLGNFRTSGNASNPIESSRPKHLDRNSLVLVMVNDLKGPFCEVCLISDSATIVVSRCFNDGCYAPPAIRRLSSVDDIRDHRLEPMTQSKGANVSLSSPDLRIAKLARPRKSWVLLPHA